jgi:hypothetical protein
MTGEYERRIKAQEERIKKQWEAAKERRKDAIRRGEAITRIDRLETKKLRDQEIMDAKWARRKIKCDARRR